MNPEGNAAERIRDAEESATRLADATAHARNVSDVETAPPEAPEGNDVTPEEFDAYVQERYERMMQGIEARIAGAQQTIAQAERNSTKSWFATPGGTWTEHLGYALMGLQGQIIRKTMHDAVHNTQNVLQEEQRSLSMLLSLKDRLERSWSAVSAIENPISRASAELAFLEETNTILGIDENANVIVDEDGKPVGEIYKTQPDFARLERDMQRVEMGLTAAEYTLRVADMAKDVAASFAGPPGIAVAMAPRYIVGLSTGEMTLEQACWQLPEDVALAYIGGKASGSVMKLLGPILKRILANNTVPGTKIAGSALRELFEEIVDAFSDSALQGAFIEVREQISGQQSTSPDYMQRVYSNFIGGMAGRGMAKGLQTGMRLRARGEQKATSEEGDTPATSKPKDGDAPATARTDGGETISRTSKQKVLTPEEETLKGTLMGLDDSVEGLTRRALYAEELLQRPLTDEQKRAVVDAHLAGTPVLAEDGTTTYSMGDLRTKMQILQRAGFSMEESDRLLRMGVTGSNAVRQAPPAPKRGEALRAGLASATNGTEVVVTSGKSVGGTTIPPGNYTLEYLRNEKGELVPTLKSHDPVDAAKGNYTIDPAQSSMQLLPKTAAAEVQSSSNTSTEQIAPRRTVDASPKDPNIRAQIVAASMRDFDVLSSLRGVSYEDLRADLGRMDYTDVLRSQQNYENRVTTMRTKRDAANMRTEEAPHEPSALRASVYEKLRGMRATTSPKDANETHSGGFVFEYGKKYDADKAQTTFYINPHFGSLDQTTKLLDNCLQGTNAQVKVNLDSISESGSGNKIIVYFSHDDSHSINLFLSRLSQRTEELEYYLDPEKFKEVARTFRIPLMPGVSLVERNSSASWDTNLRTLTPNPNVMSMYLDSLTGSNGQDPLIIFQRLVSSNLRPGGKRNPRMPGLRADSSPHNEVPPSQRPQTPSISPSSTQRPPSRPSAAPQRAPQRPASPQVSSNAPSPKPRQPTAPAESASVPRKSQTDAPASPRTPDTTPFTPTQRFRERILRTRQLSNDPNVKMSRDVAEQLDWAMQNADIRVHTHVSYEPNANLINRPAGFRTFGNQQAVAIDGITMAHERTGIVRSRKSEPDYAINDSINASNGKDSQFEREQICLQKVDENRKQIVYSLQTTQKADATGKRYGVPFHILITCDAPRADQIFAILKANPEQARAFFLAAGQDVGSAEYLFGERLPPYEELDAGTRRLYFTEDRTEERDGPALRVTYMERGRDGWHEAQIPSSSNAPEKVRQAEERRARRFAPPPSPKNTEPPSLWKRFFG